MRSTSSVAAKSSLLDVLKSADDGDFTLLQRLLNDDALEKSAWYSTLGSGKEKGISAILLLFAAVLKVFSSQDQKRINIALQVLEAVLQKITLENIKLNQAYAKLPFQLEAELANYECNKSHHKLLSLLTNKIAAGLSTWVWLKPEVRFTDSVREEKHEKQNSMQHGKRLKKSKVSRAIDVNDVLNQIPRLDSLILKKKDDASFKALVHSIELWDSKCVSQYTYHPINERIADNYYGLESWLILSLLNARFDRKRFINVISNIIDLRDALYAKKRYNSSIIISTVIESDSLNKIIKQKIVEESEDQSYRRKWYKQNFTAFQAKLLEDGINLGDHRGTFENLRKNAADPNLTVPIALLNKFMEQEGFSLKANKNKLEREKEVSNNDNDEQLANATYGDVINKAQIRIESNDEFIKTIKTNLMDDAERLDEDQTASALWDMPRVNIDDIDAQIDTKKIINEKGMMIGTKREWKQNKEQAYVKYFTPSVEVLSPEASSSPSPLLVAASKIDSCPPVAATAFVLPANASALLANNEPRKSDNFTAAFNFFKEKEKENKEIMDKEHVRLLQK